MIEQRKKIDLSKEFRKYELAAVLPSFPVLPQEEAKTLSKSSMRTILH